MAVPKNKKSTDMTDTKEDSTLPPVLIDLGKARRNRVRDLKRGKGRLLEKVDDAIEQTVKELGDEAKGKTILPVLVLVEKRPKKKRSVSSLLDFALPNRD
jgi:hypothetical protein